MSGRKRYKDEFGGYQEFMNEVFKQKFDEKWKSSGKTLNEFCSEFAVTINLSKNSIERIKSWRKGHAAPEDLDLVKDVARALGCSPEDLLNTTFIDAKRYQNEIEENRVTIEELKKMSNQPKGTWNGNSYFHCIGQDYYSFKMDGVSNLYDIIIGEGYDRKSRQSIQGNYAERIGNIAYKHEYPRLCELLGYHCKYSTEELQKIIDSKPSDADDAYYMTLFCENWVDSEGKSMYNADGKYAFTFEEFCEKLIHTPVDIDEEDRAELVEIVKELQANFDKCECIWYFLEIEIALEDKVIKTFTYGPEWANPTHPDRWELIKELMGFFDSNIDRLCLCNATEIITNQFDCKAHFKFDLAKF